MILSGSVLDLHVGAGLVGGRCLRFSNTLMSLQSGRCWMMKRCEAFRQRRIQQLIYARSPHIASKGFAVALLSIDDKTSALGHEETKKQFYSLVRPAAYIPPVTFDTN